MKVKSPETKPSKCSVNKTIVPARNRIKYSASQLSQLEKVFLSSQYPDSSILEDLSNTINIDVERLSIWFQNRRSKFKRQSKGAHVNWMRQQLYQQETSQSRDITATDKCHVLTPPTTIKKDDVKDKPKSNLHYLPRTGSGYSSLTDYDPVYNPLMFPSSHNVYSALTDAVSSTRPVQSSLHYPPLMTETSFQVTPSPQQWTEYSSQSNFTSPLSPYHQNYLLNCLSDPMTFPQIGV
ncbi:paired mesoderm homeobox protein 2-like [Haliotis rubra]|uniref:paired mesoderm homeobox protein 2-like n=1 Tax=Haliotis rubra TaxID=36100 RepID=UPI001EE57CD7|nr:paired mesoderm homeobox protein 2-like [Haliotis rubra]